MGRLASAWISCVVLAGCGGNAGTSTDAGPGSADAGSDEVSVMADVTIDSGPIHGVTDGDLVLFRGVPYATAERFAPPAAPIAWTAPLDASAFGPACAQQNGSAVVGSEDCLSINVWAHGSGPRRPVIVWIYGGGFVSGSASDPQYDAAALARGADVLVVSFNYRLGTLGFLALPELAAADGGTGNWGLRDQIAALQWVHRNIAAFGGDPDRVELAGESAGGASVCDLLASPLAQGLYSAAAIESGPCWAVAELTSRAGGTGSAGDTGGIAPAESVGETIADDLGCTDSATRAACLRGQDVGAVLAAGSAAGSTTLGGFAVTEVVPVVDGVVLDQRPFAALAGGRGAVPLIAGANHDDASIFVDPVETALGSFAAYAAAYVELNVPTAEQGSAYTAIEALYGGMDDDTAARAFATDIAFACSAQRVAEQRSAPTYLYELERAVPNGPLAQYGAVHGFDYINLFATFSEWQITPSADDAATSAAFQTAWGALAHGTAPWTAAPGYDAIDAVSHAGSGDYRGGRCATLAAFGLPGE